MKTSSETVPDLADLVQRLEAIEEELTDLAIDKLRASVEEGDPAAASTEREITRARRAVDKARAIVARLEQGSRG